MIFADSDEQRYPRFPTSLNPQLLDHLEELTGADYMVSPLALPAHSETMLVKHLEAGAFLVQVKEGWDLVNSLAATGNLWELLARLTELQQKHNLSLKPAQKIVLSLGMYNGYVDDSLKVNGQLPSNGVTFSQVDGGIERIFERGWVYRNLPQATLFDRWLTNKQHHATANLSHKPRQIISNPQVLFEEVCNDPLQELVRVRDGRKTLVTFPGMGETKVNALWEYAGGNLARALMLVSDPLLTKDKHKPFGIGKEIVKGARAWLGLQEGELVWVGRGNTTLGTDEEEIPF